VKPSREQEEETPRKNANETIIDEATSGENQSARKTVMLEEKSRRAGGGKEAANYRSKNVPHALEKNKPQQ